MRQAGAALLALVLPGCATVIDGTQQTVTLRTAPVGASCQVQRGGTVLAVVTTPATLVVQRARGDLVVDCRKPGWGDTQAVLPGRFTGVTAGNVILGGLAGVVVDEATQANYRYEEDTTILLAPPGTSGPGRPS